MAWPTEGVRCRSQPVLDLSGHKDRGAAGRRWRPAAFFICRAVRPRPGTTIMGLRTPLYDTHVAAGARIVDFGGWDMPVNYGSQIEEHHAVRRDAGMFDVSHMCVVDLRGDRVRDFLRRLLANDVAKLTRAGQGTLFMHAARRRRRHRRPDRLLPERPVVSHGRQCGHARQGPRLAAPARRRTTASRSSRGRTSR